MSQVPMPILQQGARFAAFCAVGFGCLSVVPMVAPWFGVSFVTDPILFGQMHSAAVVSAILLALVLTGALFMMPTRSRWFSLVRLLTPMTYGLLFYIAMVITVPMIWSGLWAAPTVKVVTVAKPWGLQSTLCTASVQLDSMPLHFNRLCNLPPFMRATLMEGDKVLLIGTGSRLGIYYEQVRLLPRGTDI